MALRFNLVRKIFSTGRGEWIIFIFSLLLAFFMWTIQRFSQEYSIYLNYQLTVKSPIRGRAQSSTSEDQLLVKGKCSGFYVLKRYFSFREDPTLTIKLNSNQLFKVNNYSDRFYVKTSQISSSIQSAIGQEFECEGFVTDTLFFNIPTETYKKVPVAINRTLEYLPQFMPVSEILIKPDSVFIYGEQALIGKVDSVYTRLISKKEISNDISGVIGIKPIKGITIQDREIYYSQKVERYVESSLMLPISIQNLPVDVDMTVVPSMVKLRYRAPFDNDNRIAASDFLVAVDYNDIESVVGGGVKPAIIRAPKEILDMVLEPVFVESIVLK